MKFDGLKWQHSEVGIWETLSTDVVKFYENNVDADDARLDNVIFKLKHTCYKETICKACYTLFYDKEKVAMLNKSDNLVCFKNEILNLKSGKFLKSGKRTWYLSLWIDRDYAPEDTQLMSRLVDAYMTVKARSRLHQFKHSQRADRQVDQEQHIGDD
eukprot:gene19622-26305_t